MLTYSFDLLFLIYEEEGYAPTEIPALILRHNLHGLEICHRAAQLAELALVFKAREKSRRFFQPEHLVRPRIIELRDIRFEASELKDYIHALGLGDLFNQPMLRLLHQFEEAKNFGSLIQPCLDERAIADVRRAIEAKDLGGQLFLRETHLKVLRVLEQAEALTQRYHVVVANPPYMGRGAMNPSVSTFANKEYSLGKADLFSMFIERTLKLIVHRGFGGMVTMQSWMFLPSFQKIRECIVHKHHINSLIQIGYNSFPELNSKIAQACAFVISNGKQSTRGSYFDLNDAPQSADKEQVLLGQIAVGKQYLVNQEAFSRMPGCPIAYAASSKVLDHFILADQLGSHVDIKFGMRTGDNERFLRQWFEVSLRKVAIGIESITDFTSKKLKWLPFVKGGPFRRWYGNHEYLVNWENNGEEIKTNTQLTYPDIENVIEWKITNEGDYMREGLTWSRISSKDFGVRLMPKGFIFSDAGCACFSKDSLELPLSFMSSSLASFLLKLINPTLTFQVGDIKSLPYQNLSSAASDIAKGLVRSLVSLSRHDWDNFETSWDFRDQPLLRPGLKGATLEASWRNWEAQSTAAIRRMQELETENNRLFIAAYGLDGELQPEVPEAQITLARAEARRDMAAFLSYAVGCMMGRFSLSAPGLILANAGDTLEDYWKKVASVQWPVASDNGAAGSPLATGHLPLTTEFAPDEDGIIPVLDGEWFEDDIVARTRDFLRATFGEATLRENLRFIEDSLGKDLRKYFLNDFYKDHLQTYKKRPIYWLVQSPKKGFSVLLYLHRYTRDTMNLVLNRYLRDYQVKLRNRLAHVNPLKDTAPTASEKTEARKEADKLTKTLHECEEWERQTLLPLAQARIELDLDDGVKVNYMKLGEALAPIPGLAAKED